METSASPAIGEMVETHGQRRSRRALAAVMLGAGVLHFVIPDTYARIVPRHLGDVRTIVYASGVVEALCGLLLANRRTSRLGGWCTAVVLVVVFPANVKMALDAGAGAGDDALASPVVAWLRLPLQVPLVVWALRCARRPSGSRPTRSA